MHNCVGLLQIRPHMGVWKAWNGGTTWISQNSVIFAIGSHASTDNKDSMVKYSKICLLLCSIAFI